MTSQNVSDTLQLLKRLGGMGLLSRLMITLLHFIGKQKAFCYKAH